MAIDRLQGLALRVDRLMKRIAEAADIVLIYGSGRHELVRSNWCWFYSGVRQIGLDSCLILVPGEAPLLVTSPSWDAHRARRWMGAGDVLACDDILNVLTDQARRRKWSSRRAMMLGFADAPGRITTAVTKLFAQVTTDPDVLPRSQDELGLSQIRRAVAIAEGAVASLAEVIRPGISENALISLCIDRLRAYGSDANFVVLSSSAHHVGPTPPSGRSLAEGDIVLAEVSPSVEGQYAQICRPLVVGKPADVVLRNHLILEEAFEAAFAAGRPGVLPASLMQAANKVIARHGFGEYNGPRYMRARGHAVGLGPMHPQTVSDEARQPLESGVSFVLHPNQYFPDSGYLFYGTQVVMTEAGLRRMSDATLTLNSHAGSTC